MVPAPGLADDNPVSFAVIPAGKAVHFQHKGPCSRLRAGHEALTGFVNAENLDMAAPTWEVCPNEPAHLPEDELFTDVFCKDGKVLLQ